MRKLDRAVTKTALRLFTSNLEVLRNHYPTSGYNHVVRLLVDRHCRRLEERVAEHLGEEKLSPEELNG